LDIFLHVSSRKLYLSPALGGLLETTVGKANSPAKMFLLVLAITLYVHQLQALAGRLSAVVPGGDLVAIPEDSGRSISLWVTAKPEAIGIVGRSCPFGDVLADVSEINGAVVADPDTGDCRVEVCKA
jgi:hypothetical protein